MIERRRKRALLVDISFPGGEIRPPAAGARRRAGRVRVNHGRRSKYCSFVVPYTRSEVSRPFEDVLTEVADLADQGVREITLLGQNVSATAGACAPPAFADLATLIEYLADIDSLERIRFTTSHPGNDAPADRRVRAYPQAGVALAPAGAVRINRVLAAMKRGYTAVSTSPSCGNCATRPGTCSSGHHQLPGETDADFERR
jgi:tRNA-2-methylthio-N6-dimethylallyladenosine synthase